MESFLKIKNATLGRTTICSVATAALAASCLFGADGQPAMRPLEPARVSVGGILGTAIDASHRGRLRGFIKDPSSKPIALFSVEAVEKNFEGDWNGEHAGKWLYTAARAANRANDPELAASVKTVADWIVARQDPSGYLGTYAPSAPSRMTAPNITSNRTWDLWVHAYLIVGLLETNKYFPDSRYVAAARKIGDLCYDLFVTEKRSVADMGNHLGLSGTVLLEPAVDLYEATRDPRYLLLARTVVAQMEARPALGLVAKGVNGTDLLQIGDGKIYQMLWTYTGLAKLFANTGEATYRQAIDHAWLETSKYHLTLDGGPWGGVAAHHEVYNPRDFWSPNGIVETCSTMSWLHLNRELLRLTGEAKYAEEIEKTAYNSLLGAQDPNGEDWYYFSFPNGRRNNTYYWACCKSSGALALEELPPLVFGRTADGIAVNLYTPATGKVPMPGGDVTLSMKTSYPRAEEVRIGVDLAATEAFPLLLRIPSWANGAVVLVNGKPADTTPTPGEYVRIARTWRGGDEVTLKLPMKIRVARQSEVAMQKEQEISRLDYFAIQRGPLVYATGLIDGYKRQETLHISSNSVETMIGPAPLPKGASGPAFQLKLPGRSPIVFVPFYEAGGRADGNWRISWLQVAWK